MIPKIGNDLFDIDFDILRFKAYFSNDDIEIEEHIYKHCELLTEFLNYDTSIFDLPMKEMRLLRDEKQIKTYHAVERKLWDMIFELPLYRDMKYRRSWLEMKRMDEPFANMNDYEKIYADLKLLEQYRWFLREVFNKSKWKVDTNKFCELMGRNDMFIFTRSVSLGADNRIDPVNIEMQYELLERDSKPCLYEKVFFYRLVDFFYLDLFKGIMHNYCPKPCKLCGKFFLQENGLAFEYCENTAPDETTKTCRDIGAVQGFRNKIKNNPIWEIHQRAYKKYHARKRKGKMSEVEFSEWVLMAEKLRDEWLTKYESDNSIDLQEYRTAINSK